MAEPVSAAPEAMRVSRFLARCGAVESRRKAELAIEEGRVTVNGEVRTDLGVKCVPGTDEVRLDGEVVELEGERVVLMLNKPAGYITAMSDQWGNPTAADLVPTDRYPGLYSIGRLDRDTTGLLLFTTDGALGHALIHPSKHVDKTYEAWVRGIPTESQLNVLRKGGMVIEGKPIKPAEVELLESRRNANKAKLSITIHEGRKRQVRIMCKNVKHPVLELHRVTFGPLELGDLPEGQWRLLDDEELRILDGLMA